MTQKMTVVYKAPPGDSKITEAFGHTFFDGKPEDIEVSDAVAEKIKKNPVFQPGGRHPEPDKPDVKHDAKHK